jgi:hypothetical protein
MDWIKVLNRHVIFEYTDLSDSEFRAWVTIMSLTAELEHEPNNEQMLQYVHHKTLTSLQDKLKKHSTTLQDVLKKVSRDVQEVIIKRESWKEKKKILREVNRSVSKDVLGDVQPQEKRREEKRREENKEIKKGATFVPPTLQEVSTYCKERKNSIDPQKWLDHYTSNGWMVGKNKMKNWQAAVRTWENSDIGSGNGSRKGFSPPPMKQERNPFTTCDKCGEEYMETDIVDVDGSFYCPKCPEARAAFSGGSERARRLLAGIGGRASP